MKIDIKIEKTTCPYCNKTVYPEIEHATYHIRLNCPRCGRTIEMKKIKR